MTVQSVWNDPGDWVVRPVSGAAAVKTYRCPGCEQEIPTRTPHVVAWPIDRLSDRRHWHTPCWARRVRRAPAGRRARVVRRSADAG